MNDINSKENVQDEQNQIDNGENWKKRESPFSGMALIVAVPILIVYALLRVPLINAYNSIFNRIESTYGYLVIKSGGQFNNNLDAYIITNDPIKIDETKEITATMYINQANNATQNSTTSDAITNIKIYPTICADLLGSSFDIQGPPCKQSTVNESSLSWTWTIAPKKIGEDQIIELYVYTEVSTTDDNGNLVTSSKQLISKPIRLVYSVRTELGLSSKVNSVIVVLVSIATIIGVIILLIQFVESKKIPKEKGNNAKKEK